MKKLFLICFAACLCAAASAQKVYFLYLQSDDQTPFYIKMGDKIHSSATAGYLILPNLPDSTYSFGLGFAKSTATEARFSVTINQNDKGFIIKNFNDELALFNIQDLSLVKSNVVQQDNTVYETKDDRFSTILSKAANDPGLLKVPVAKKEEPVAEKVAEKEKVADKEIMTAKLEETKPLEPPVADTIANQLPAETAKTKTVEGEIAIVDSASVQTVSTEAKEASVQPLQIAGNEAVQETVAAVYKPSVISRYSESSTTEGFGIVYFDKKEDGIDTIRILIPAPKVKLVAETETAATDVVQKEEKRDSTMVLEKSIASDDTPNENTSGVTVVTASNCKSTANAKDFLKLRRKMVAKDNDDDMLDEARKELRDRCYSVDQVRSLSALFLTSASKYRFFDAAYEHVSDKSNFASLGSEIRDEHYTKRFKALIGE